MVQLDRIRVLVLVAATGAFACTGPRQRGVSPVATGPTVDPARPTRPAAAPAQPRPAAAPAQPRPAAGPWFAGTPDQAMAHAARHRQPVLLYWGAVWCPPCNQLKAEVFSHPEFPALLGETTAIYLDGDSEAAQTWADRLKVSGYPTVLLLTPEGTEVMRLHSALGFTEFREAFLSGLAARRPFADTLQRALDGRGDPLDWRILAGASWYDTAGLGLTLPPAALLTTLGKLVDGAPAALRSERAVLAAALLSQAAGTAAQPQTGEPGEARRTEQALRSVRERASALVDLLLADAETIFATRETLVDQAPELVAFCAGDDPARRTALQQRWLAATETIAAAPEAALALRLRAHRVPLALHLGPPERGDARPASRDIPAPLRQRIRSAVRWADAQARSPFERHSVISDAAEMLAEIGDHEAAQALLLREMKTTDTPWYFQSTLASIEEERGRRDEALRWSRAASRSARGPATRIQWLSSHVVRLTRLGSGPEMERELTAALDELFQVVEADPGGFSGRNAVRLGKVADSLQALRERPAVRATLARHAGQCAGLQHNAPACSAYFARFAP
jgi:protein disulfide-isomerase